MFIDKNYVLANEIVSKSGINISNISMLINKLDEEGISNIYKKLGNCTFINTKPNEIKHLSYLYPIISSIDDFTDIYNKLPVSYLLRELGVSKKNLLKIFEEYIIGETTIAGKDFFVFKDDFVKELKDKVIYVLDINELNECKKIILGWIQLSKKKVLVWY